jgi:hypothetical protein
MLRAIWFGVPFLVVVFGAALEGLESALSVINFLTVLVGSDLGCFGPFGSVFLFWWWCSGELWEGSSPFCWRSFL